MRSVICLLTAAIVFGACSGDREVRIKQADGTYKATAMTPAEELDMRQNAVQSGVQYIGGCTLGDDEAYGNEIVLYNGPAGNLSPCVYVGGGSSTTWMFSFDHGCPGAGCWRYFGSTEQPLDNNVQNAKARPQWGHSPNRIAYHLNTSFGGGSHIELNNVNGGQLISWSDPQQTGSSFVMCKLVGGVCQ